MLKNIFFIVLLCASAIDAQYDSHKDIKDQRTESFNNLEITADPFLEELSNQVIQNNLVNTIDKLQNFQSRHIQSDSLLSAKNYLIGEFEALGYAVTLHDFTYGGKNLSNIIVTIPGAAADKLVVVGAHYDSISPNTDLAPGADDNGSGVAAVLEAARILKNYSFGYSIALMLYSAEEEGLIGSGRWVNEVALPNNLDIQLMLNMDMIGGDADKVNDKIFCERDEDSNPSGNNAASWAYTDSLAAFISEYTNLTPVISNAYASDYMTFEDAGYTITGLFEYNWNPNYHQSNDILAGLDTNYVFQVVRGVIPAIAHFAGVRSSYCSIFTEPILSMQDSSNNYPVYASVISSSSIASSKLYYSIFDGAFIPTEMNYIGAVGDTLLYSGEIPKQNFGTEINYYLLFQNDEGITSTSPSDGGFYTFTVQPDNVSPVLEAEAVKYLTMADIPYAYYIAASDENGIKEVKLFYSVNGNEEISEPFLFTMANNYELDFAPQASIGDSISYYIVAADNSSMQNTTRFPAEGVITFRILKYEINDFENGEAGFTGGGDWEWGESSIVAAHSGTKLWGTKLNSNYSADKISDLTFDFDLTDKREAYLNIMHYFYTEPGNDGGNVSISIDGGNTFSVLQPASGYNTDYVYALGGQGFSGNSYFWLNDIFSLNDYLGEPAIIKFNFASDIVVNFKGWYLDDIRIDYLTYDFVPVELNYFSVDYADGSVALKWETASELNVEKFIIEKQIQNESPARIAEIFSNGNGVSVNKYSISDKDVVKGKKYNYFLYEENLSGEKNLLSSQAIKITDIPNRFYLEQNFPNPFNPSTKIKFGISKKSFVKLEIYNILGSKVQSLVNENLEAGNYEINLNMSGNTSGVYFYQLSSGDKITAKKFTLIK